VLESLGYGKDFSGEIQKALDEIIQDNSGLDLSGLSNLEDVMFSLTRKRVGGAIVHAPFQERDLATFGKLTRLKRLQISHGGATNASLGYLTGLSRLERLSLGGDGLTNEGLAHLASLVSLRNRVLLRTISTVGVKRPSGKAP
jgi:hypothetical protein